MEQVQIPLELPITPHCSINSTHLRSLQDKFQLGDRIKYGRRYMRFHRRDIQRISLTKINANLFPTTFDIIDIQFPASYNDMSQTTRGPSSSVAIPEDSRCFSVAVWYLNYIWMSE